MNVPSHLLISLAIYLVALLAIGFYAGRNNKNANDYLVASHGLPTWVAILTLTATMFGGGMLVGRAQQGYNNGPVFFIYSCGAVVGQILLALLIKKMDNFSHYTTVAQYLEDRYHSKFVRTGCAMMSMIACVGLTASQVSSLVGVLNAMGFTNVKLTAFCCMIVIIALTVFGGFMAVAITDSFQIILVMIGVATLLITVLTQNGGYGGIVAALEAMPDLPQEYFLINNERVMMVIWMVLPGVMYTLIGQDGYLRLFACKNLTEARKASVIGGILMTAISLCPIVIGMVARIDFPELAANGTTSSALAMVALKYLPGFGAGLFLCAILSAILSTGDSLLSAASSHFITDFWVIFVDKDADMNGKRLMTVSRIFTLVAGVFALFISFQMTDIVAALVNVYTLYVAGAFTPIVMGVLWKGANKYGAAAGLVVGTVIAIYGIITGFTLGSIPGALLSFIAAGIVTVVVSLATKDKVAAEN